MELSLYRKYRPKTFDDLVGQDHIKQTIENAVHEGSLAHAYLFCGPRGTGKTTVARLLAKALLCEKGPTASPDGTCEQCVEVAEGTHPDVHELDAASRTGVDAVREEIIGRVQFAPTRGAYKIYIIDEVHMLSTAAFNALLKTLEEPPAHVVFIMCTTHPHKVPDTIQSRCQRFDFHRISDQKIADNLQHISDGEGYSTDREALTLIAQHSVGGMRDAITTLEQLAAFTGGKIAASDVEELIGRVDEDQIFELSKAIATRDVAGCFEASARLADEGVDFPHFTKDLTAHIRDLYVITLVGSAEGVIDADAKKITRLTALAKAYGEAARLARSLEVLGDLSRELRDATDPRLRFEIALIRIARPEGDITLSALDERLRALEAGGFSGGASYAAGTSAAMVREVIEPPTENSEPAPSSVDAAAPAGAVPQPAPSEAVEALEPVVAVEEKPEVEATSSNEVPSSGLDLAAARRGWDSARALMKREQPARAALFAGTSVDIAPDGALLIVFPSDQTFSAGQINENPEYKNFVDETLQSVFKKRVAFRATAGGEKLVVPDYPAPEITPEALEMIEQNDPDDYVPLEDELVEESVVVEEVITPKPSAESKTLENGAVTGDVSLSDMLASGFGADIVIEEVADDSSGENETE